MELSPIPSDKLKLHQQIKQETAEWLKQPGNYITILPMGKTTEAYLSKRILNRIKNISDNDEDTGLEEYGC